LREIYDIVLVRGKVYIIGAIKMRMCKYIKLYSDNFFLLSYSDLFRVSIDPRVKPEGDGSESVPRVTEKRVC